MRKLIKNITKAAVLLTFLTAVTACSSIETLDPNDTRKRTLKVSELGKTRAYASNDFRGAIPSLDHQMSWRAQSLAANPSFDPALRPRYVPKSFDQVAWTHEIPLLSPKVDAILTSDFGWRGLYGRTDYHSGIDIAADAGTRIYTPVSGEVLYVKHAGTDSGLVVTDGERQHTFWHTRPASGLRKGQWIKAGTPVGTLVAWGSRTHLHYSVHLTGPSKSSKARNDSNAIDPLTLVKRLRETVVPLDGVQLSSVVRDAVHRSLVLEAARTPVARMVLKPAVTLPARYRTIQLSAAGQDLGYRDTRSGYSVETLMLTR